MKSFIITVEKFLKMDTEVEECNFPPEKRKLVIPLYQREFKWSDEKIVGLIGDISRRDKFLGNIILDEQTDRYEIVDGQQRITTCFLTLLCLYNHYAGSPLEQNSIRRLLKPYESFLLINETVGEYVFENGHLFELSIREADDIYYQKCDFERAYNTIFDEITRLEEQGALREFKSKLLDCELLILINDQHRNANPVEQVFLDINEKAQLLEVEDIFKGHCFENYDDTYHRDLRNIWVELKKWGMKFVEFGFENLSQYLYLYLLNIDSLDIPEKLTKAGKHYLDGKTMDETSATLNDMIVYGKAVAEAFSKINANDYRFEDMCTNSREYRNTNDHKILKTMLKEMFCTKAQYQKLPLFYFLYSLKINPDLPGYISHLQFRSLITNLYVYATLFVYTLGKKSKRNIDHTIRDCLRASPLEFSSVLSASKDLRREKVFSYEFSMVRGGFEWLSFAYSILDFYNAEQNWLCEKYRREDGYNLEHFLIPDIRSRCVTWVDGENSFELTLRPSLVTAYKKYSINYLIIDEELNGEMGHDDVLEKILHITSWFEQREKPLPNHIRLIFGNIQSMPEYTALVALKGIGREQQEIILAYNEFLEAYFRENHAQALLTSIEQAFKDAFRNHDTP